MKAIPIGKNRIINGDFRINQRNNNSLQSQFITYSLDRWYTYVTGGTASINNTNTRNGNIRVLSVYGAASGVNYIAVGQRIEAFNVLDLIGQPITVSGWMYNSAGGQPLLQIGIPGAADNWSSSSFLSGVAPALPNLPANVWTRFSVTFIVPASCSGGFGLEFQCPFAAGATFSLSDIQLEEGNTATLFERRPYPLELSLCQRYYQTIPNIKYWMYAGAGSQAVGQTITYNWMRGSPTVVANTSSLTNCSGITVEALTQNSLVTYAMSSAAGQVCPTYSVTLSAEL